MKNQSFPITSKNQVRQASQRGIYDRESVFEILDQSLIGHVAFNVEDDPVVIPILFARRDDELLFHGSTKSRLMNALTSGQPICVSVTLTDGIVLAKSLFHHSMNYRSVTVFGSGRELTTESDRIQALRSISEKVIPHRWHDARPPSTQEMKATCVASVKIEFASAKVRSGGPVEDAKDVVLPFWAGVLPLRTVAETPIPSSDTRADVAVPEYLKKWQASFNS